MNKSKGVYIHAGSDTMFSGVDKKIQNQIKAFSAYFDMREVIIKKSPTNVLKSIGYRLPFGSFGREYEVSKKEIISCGAIGFFYIRDLAWDRKWRDFIRWLRENHPDSKILLEIPTYPYGLELLSSRTMWPWYFKDNLYKKYAHRYIDRIVTYSDDDVIYDIPTIKIMNGVDVSGIRPSGKIGGGQ